MAQNTTNDSSGMGVVLGILLAVVVAIGAYFFIANRDGATGLEPAAGDTTVNIAPGDAGTDAGAGAGTGAGGTDAAPAQ